MLGSILTQILLGTTLHDGEERLVIAIEWFCLVETLHATLQPSLCKSQTFRSILIVALSRWTLVECHHDIGTNHAFGVHHILGCEDMFRAVNMTTELATLLSEFADTGEREHLKTTRVGQNRTIPGIELVQSTCLAEDIQSRTEIQMVGIAQNDLRLDLFAKLGEMHRLHTSHRTDGHEDGGLNLTVIGGDQSCTGVTRIVTMLYLKSHAYFCFFSSSGIVKSSGWATISLVSAKFHTSCTFST